jgi:hypothetical protein
MQRGTIIQQRNKWCLRFYENVITTAGAGPISFDLLGSGDTTQFQQSSWFLTGPYLCAFLACTAPQVPLDEK